MVQWLIISESLVAHALGKLPNIIPLAFVKSVIHEQFDDLVVNIQILDVSVFFILSVLRANDASNLVPE